MGFDPKHAPARTEGCDSQEGMTGGLSDSRGFGNRRVAVQARVRQQEGSRTGEGSATLVHREVIVSANDRTQGLRNQNTR